VLTSEIAQVSLIYDVILLNSQNFAEQKPFKISK